MRAVVLEQVKRYAASFIDGDDFAVEQGIRGTLSHTRAICGNWDVKSLPDATIVLLRFGLFHLGSGSRQT
jgi:hypothetical protein